MKHAIVLILTIFFALTTSAIAIAGSPPSVPSNLRSLTHTVGVPSTKTVIKVMWTPSTDPDGDLNGYGTKWDNYADTTMTPKTHEASATSAQSDSLADGNWYFHIRAIDDQYNRSSMVHLGPFVIDTQPNIISITPTSGINTADTEITITGTEFITGATIKIGEINLINVIFINSGMLQGTLPSGFAEPGTYSLQITNPNGKTDIKENFFTIVQSGEPVKGDINGDNKVNLTDAILGLQICIGLNPEGINLKGDINSDGKIGLEEVIYILQKISGIL